MLYFRALPITFTIVTAMVSFQSNTYAQTAVRIKIITHSETRGTPPPVAIKPEDRTTIIYAQNGRIRTESSAFGQFPPLVIIQRCDMGVTFVLNPAKHEYTEQLIPTPQQPTGAVEGPHTEPPNWLIDSHTVDTGETKAAFGHTAHHYITTMKQTPSPELDQQPGETVIDAWHLDMPDVTRCQPASRGYFFGFVGAPAQKFRPEFRYSGPEPKGLVLSEIRTQSSFAVRISGNKQERSLIPTSLINSREIVELSEVPIDAAIFEVPPGFTKVETITP